MGAHPDSPSRSISHREQPGLDALIQADPAGLLGPAVAAEFGPRLPFLLKVLAAERALSIQVHPNLAQARAGYQAEQAAGVPTGSARTQLLRCQPQARTGICAQHVRCVLRFPAGGPDARVARRAGKLPQLRAVPGTAGRPGRAAGGLQRVADGARDRPG